MTNRTLWCVSLGLAGVLQCGMAAYHFVLPYHLGWATGHGLENLPDSMVWALYVLNFSWSLLVLVTGSLVCYAAIIGPTTAAFTRRALLAVGLFWAIHAGYVWFNPMPLPERLLWLQIVLAAFPVTVALLHWVPVVASRELDLAGRV